MRSHTPRNIGLFLLLVGTAPLFLAIIEYAQTITRLTGARGKIFVRPGFLTAVAIVLIGLALTITTVLRINLV